VAKNYRGYYDFRPKNRILSMDRSANLPNRCGTGLDWSWPKDLPMKKSSWPDRYRKEVKRIEREMAEKEAEYWRNKLYEGIKENVQT
jgi:hypothetical protein